MQIPPYLQNQKLHDRKPFSLHKLTFFLLVVSLGFNVYFMWGENSGESIEVPPQVAELTSLESAVMENQITPAIINEETGQSTSIIQKTDSVSLKAASFSLPDSFKGREIYSLNLKIRNSLHYSVCKSMPEGEGCDLMSAYLGRLLAWFFDIHKSIWSGDTLKVIYEKTPNQDRFKILKLSYRSGQFKKTFEANYYEGGDFSHGSYFDPEGREIARRIADNQSPIEDYQEITSLPGDFRKGTRGHSGTDFKAEVGTPVFASFDGKVTRTNWNTRANGYCVEIDHPRYGVKTLYLHLSRVFVKPGQYVKQGHPIAESGNTGRTFAPHLHYEILSRDRRKIIYNPFEFKHHNTYRRSVPPEESAGFQKMVKFYDSVLQES